jgi:hypothetical protein
MNTEPVAISTALGVLLSSLVAWAALILPNGLTPELQVATIALGNAFIGVGVILYGRAKSTPIAAPVVPAGTAVTVVTPGPTPNTTVTV